jgi:hypothetical protein
MTPQEYGLQKVAYSTSETLKILPVGRTRLYEFVKRGILRPGKNGKKNIFFAVEIAALLDGLRDPTFFRDRGGAGREEVERMVQGRRITEEERARRNAAAEELLADAGWPPEAA